MLAEFSVTGLTSLVFIHLQYCLAKTCITSKPNFLTLVFDTFFSYHKVSQCIVCHKETRTSLREQHFICEECRNHCIDVKDRDNERRGWAQAEVVYRKQCVLRDGPSGSARSVFRIYNAMRTETSSNTTFLFDPFLSSHFNVLFLLPFNQMIDDDLC